MKNKINISKPENNFIVEIFRFKQINKLKSIYRLNPVDKRKESSAEHSWSALVLADFMLERYNLKLDRLKVYELLMYHDLAEIHTGDFPLSPLAKFGDKQQKELEASKLLKTQLPKKLGEKYFQTFMEFEERKTLEAKFARMIDVFDAQIHEIDYKKDWKGWTKKFLLDNKLKYFEEFPQVKKDFLLLVDYLEEKGYFS
jgi:putative hydrolases of HD superfamily